MLRIGLIQPRGNFLSHRGSFRELWESTPAMRASSFFTPIPNLGLLTVAALTDPRHRVEFIDENLAPIDFDVPFDLVGISAMTLHAKRAYEVAAAFRARGARVVMGGMHASVCPEEASAHVDAVVVGEAEGVWEELIRDAEGGALRNLYRRDNGAADLAASPIPRFDLADLSRYQVVAVQSGRGCPHDCEFCSVRAVSGRKLRQKGVGRVVDEVRGVLELTGRRRPRIFFADDNMFLDREYAKALLGELSGLRINWMTQCDISVADDEELLRLVRSSGGSQLLVGFESLDRENLLSLGGGHFKARRLDTYAESVRRIQSHGIRVLGMFIAGLDHDTPEAFDRIREFILSNHLHDAQITFPTPLPGTRLYERFRREGRLLKEKFWDECSFFNLTFRHPTMSREELEKGHLSLYRAILAPEVAAASRRHFIDVFKAGAARELPGEPGDG